jgi:hypothetical protein
MKEEDLMLECKNCPNEPKYLAFWIGGEGPFCQDCYGKVTADIIKKSQDSVPMVCPYGAGLCRLATTGSGCKLCFSNIIECRGYFTPKLTFKDGEVIFG